ncbi:MAG: hypothetical protein FJY80_07345 [Candidatus Aminicenantes bacterium]|nr:hypothetical protein [Candidatus Aminicenantes bacterium]
MAFKLDRRRNILLFALGIFLLSFAGADYYLRGQLYYTKRVVNSIHRATWQALFPPSGPVELFVRLAADQSYRRVHPEWKTRLREVFGAASARFAREFDVTLSLLGVEAWDRPEGMEDYAEILKYASRKLARHGADISVVMTAKDAGWEGDERWRDAGIAYEQGNCAVVGDDELLVHELGHLFGAKDYAEGDPLYDAESTYSYKHAAKTAVIDPANRARVNKLKYRWLW